mmetsp:Transcript_73250/g.214770  ORF Transcript_73250/g.214770 Transcript_73250/m.214770 type:complete len:249 (-) Transcript_73250:51-797(-)
MQHLLRQTRRTPHRLRRAICARRGRRRTKRCGSCLQGADDGFSLGAVAQRSLCLSSLGLCLGRGRHWHIRLSLCNRAACRTVSTLRPSERGEASPGWLGPGSHGLGEGSSVAHAVDFAIELELDAALVRASHGQAGHPFASCIPLAASARSRCRRSDVRRKADGVRGSDLLGDGRQARCNFREPLRSCSTRASGRSLGAGRLIAGKLMEHRSQQPAPRLGLAHCRAAGRVSLHAANPLGCGLHCLGLG